jgi:autotransporter-associated beta strand protein
LMGSSNVFSISSGQQTISGSIGGWKNSPGSLSKQGTGTLILSASNTFPGGTFVNAGSLRIDGNHKSSSNLVVNAGGTIAGTGTVGVLAINTGGTLSPGPSIGKLSAGNTTWNGAGNYNWQLYDGAGAAGIGYDVLSINGTLNVSNASGFNINLSTLSSALPETDGNAINFTNTHFFSWTLVQTTGGIVGFNPANFIINTSPANGTSGFANWLYIGHFTVSVVGNNLVLNFVVPPFVGIQPVTAVSATSATLNGIVNPLGLTTTWYYQYGTTAAYGSSTATNTLSSTSPATWEAISIGGLTPNTLYHFTLAASNSAGVNSAGDATFTTLAAVLTQAATSVTASTATLNASVDPGGAVTTNFFQYGLTTSYGGFSPTNIIPAGSGPVSANASIAGLSPGALYHFRAAAGSSAGVAYGADLTFTTATVSPATLQQPVMLANGAFSFTFSNAPGAPFSAWAAQNVSLALSNWTLLGPAQEVSPGQYQFTDPQATNFAQRFYIIRSP